jgi:putative flippase GtrA
MSSHRKLLAFGLVGALGTGAHYLVLVALVEAFSFDPTAATTVGFVVGALVNYLLSHRYVFASAKAHLDAGPKFFLIAAITGFMNTFMLHAGVRWAGVNYLLAQVVSTAIIFFVNYALNSLWSFREMGSLRNRGSTDRGTW